MRIRNQQKIQVYMSLYIYSMSIQRRSYIKMIDIIKIANFHII